jgi:hypothetical protein
MVNGWVMPGRDAAPHSPRWTSTLSWLAARRFQHLELLSDVTRQITGIEEHETCRTRSPAAPIRSSWWT